MVPRIVLYSEVFYQLLIVIYNIVFQMMKMFYGKFVIIYNC